MICNCRYAEVFFPGREDLTRPGVHYQRLLEAFARSGRLAPPECGTEAWVRWRQERHHHLDEPFEIGLADGRCFRATERPTAEGGTVSVFAEVTDLKAKEAALEASERRFRSLVENMRGIIFCRGVAGDGPHGYGEDGARLYGVDAPRFAGTADEGGHARIAAWYEAVHPEDRPAYLAAEARRKALGEPYALAYRVTHPGTGEERWMREVAWVVEDPAAGRTYFDSYIIDITEQKRTEERVREAALRDPLTGLPNRALFRDRLATRAGGAGTRAARSRCCSSTWTTSSASTTASATPPVTGCCARSASGWGASRPATPWRGSAGTSSRSCRHPRGSRTRPRSWRGVWWSAAPPFALSEVLPTLMGCRNWRSSTAAVTSSCACAGDTQWRGDVDEVHDRAAKDQPEGVGVVRQHDLHHFGRRLGGTLRCQVHSKLDSQGSTSGVRRDLRVES